MKQLFKPIFFMISLFVIGTSFADETIVDKATGKTFPLHVSYNLGGKEWNLSATGVSTRTKFFVKVYSVAHYLQDGVNVNKSSVFNQIFNDSFAKQLTLIWGRDVDAKTIRNGYLETLKQVFSQGQLQTFQPQIDEFLGFYSENAKVNDKHVLRWAPGGILQVEINGVLKGEITNADFAPAVWGIWLSPKSVVNRNQLVSRIGQ